MTGSTKSQSAGGIAPSITEVTPTPIVWTDSDVRRLDLSGSDPVIQIDGGAGPAVGEEGPGRR